MKPIIVFIIAIFCNSCFVPGDSFEKAYYEKITAIKFPHDYVVLETFDNGEWLTGTVLKIDNLTLSKFITENHFESAKDLNDFHLLGNSYLNNYKTEFKNASNVYYLSKSRDKNNWTYVADLDRNILWAEISYPDWGGR